MFGLFLFLTLAWCVVMVVRRDSVHRIHFLMGGLVLFKTLTLMAQVRRATRLGLQGAKVQLGDSGGLASRMSNAGC